MLGVIVRWLAAKAMNWAVAKQQQEIADFVQRTSAADSSELGLPVLMATTYRHITRRNGGPDLLFPSIALTLEPMICNRLNREIRELQSDKLFGAAAAVMIWLHSLRAMQDLKLRPYGRQLWFELSRGFPHVISAANDYALTTNKVPEIEGYDQIPDGLGPQI